MPNAGTDAAKLSSIPPFDPDPAKDGDWVKLLQPSDRLTYRTAKQAFDQADMKYKDALSAAEKIVKTADDNFKAARTAAMQAGEDLDTAVKDANAAKDALGKVKDLKTDEVRENPDRIAEQAADVKAKAADYQTANGKVAAAQTAYVAKVAALAKLAEPGFTDPASADIDEDQLAIAEANRDIAIAAAEKPRDAALNTFYTARFTLYNTIDDD